MHAEFYILINLQILSTLIVLSSLSNGLINLRKLYIYIYIYIYALYFMLFLLRIEIKVIKEYSCFIFFTYKVRVMGVKKKIKNSLCRG